MNNRIGDLNLLRALDALLRVRHVGRAAVLLGTSQPAASRALAALRRAFDDPLLVRMRGTYALTPRAEALAAELPRHLDAIDRLLEPARFDPSRAEGVIRLGALDYEGTVLLPALIDRLSREAPGLRLDVVGGDAANLIRVLDGTLDCSIQSPERPPPGCLRRVLFDDRLVTLHPARMAPLDLAAFAAGRHVLVGTPDDEASTVDEALAAQGLRRTVAVRVPYFAAAHRIAARGRLLFTGPARLFRALGVPPGMALAPPPVPGLAEAFAVCLYWHERRHRDPMLRWLRRLMARIARSELSRAPRGA